MENMLNHEYVKLIDCFNYFSRLKLEYMGLVLNTKIINEIYTSK